MGSEASPTAALLGFAAGRFGLWRLIKWVVGLFIVLVGIGGLRAGSSIGTVVGSIGLIVLPLVWFLAKRRIRKGRMRRLYVQALDELSQEWKFTGNEAGVRQRAVEIGRVVGLAPEVVWQDLQSRS